jgi:DNA repair protein RadA/Sms
MASSLKDKPISHKVVAFGEVGLTGEVRGVSGISQRLHEASRLGFTHAIVPAQGTSKIQAPEGMTLCRVKTIRDAMVVSLGIEAESERRQAEN